MENKQTAVEWLVEQLPLIQQEGLRDIIEQAKEMEKQQIIDSNEDASTNELGEFLTGEQYYNKEYGNET
jgi:hypothetical protein